MAYTPEFTEILGKQDTNKADLKKPAHIVFIIMSERDYYAKVSQNTLKPDYNDPLQGGHAH